MEGKFDFLRSKFFFLCFISYKHPFYFKVGILAIEYLHSLTEPKEDSESKESTDAKDKEVRRACFLR